MGTGVSKDKVNEYKEVVKDRMSEEAIAFLYMKFSAAAPDGAMTPLQFKKYIDNTGVYKNKKVDGYIAASGRRLSKSGGFANAVSGSMPTSNGGGAAPEKEKAKLTAGDREETDEEDDVLLDPSAVDCYPHLFRGYDLDRDGVIHFKEFLLYHLAILYSTEELFYIVFNAYDADRDGHLSFGDIKGVIMASTRYVGDYDVRDREVQRVIDEEARRLFGFLDIRKQGRVQMEDMHLICQKYPQVLEKMKNLM